MAHAVRKPAVAGQFYSADSERLRQEVGRFVSAEGRKKKCLGVVSPHAGLMYSGAVAGAVYSAVVIPPTVVLLGPNHTGIGPRAAVMATGAWALPTGTLTVDNGVAAALLSRSALLSEDSSAHLFEHSLEVQLPFIHFFREDVKIVPVTMMHLSLDECIRMGSEMAEAIRAASTEILMVASSDMSHYVPDRVAREKDRMAIDRMLEIDPEGLYEVVERHSISMCGFVPATVMLAAARDLGAKSAELVKYATSAETSGDYGHVVGYSGILVGLP
ncbi:MAG: AmmeMemoRadiSam system protein B [Thermodesulfovibrionales bacterium]